MTAEATADVRARAPLGRRRALTLAVWQVAVGAAIAGCVELLLFYSGNPAPPTWAASLFVVTAWSYVAAGAFAWLRRPGSRMGLLLTAGAYGWLASGLLNAPVPALSAIGAIVQTLPIAVVVHLLLAFPSGRLRGAAARGTVAAMYAVLLVLQAPRWLLGPGPLQVAENPRLLDVAVWVQRGAAIAVLALAAWLLTRRLREVTRPRRRVLAPLSLYGIGATLAIPLGAALADLLDARGSIVLGSVQLVLAAGVPVAFAIAVARGGFARTSEIEELGARLAEEEGGGRPALADLLAETLGDASVELLFRVPGEERWVSAAGVAAIPPAASDRRGVAEVDLAGETIGAIVYDATLLTRPEEVREAARLVALALDRERLTVELRASRARLVEAGDAERRRIARDLHDGLQSRLVLLAIEAGVGRRSTDDLRLGIESAIDELRALVHGVMPAELTERGLPAAVERLADRMPIDTAIDVTGFERRPSPAVESTAYFVTAEAMANAVKHARAGQLSVTLRHDRQRLRIEVRDDGIGGAGARPGAGAGVRSIADRVEALGGVVRIESPIGAGTRVTAELPCAS